MKTKLTLAFAFSMMMLTGFSQQQNDQVLVAFSKSYEYEYAQNYSKALSTLKDVYFAGSYDLNLRLGWISYEAAEQKQSIAYYKKAIELSPNSVEARMGLVYPHSILGNWDEIAKVYAEILKIDPNHAVVNFRMGLISYNKKEYSKALEYCTKVKQLYPFDYDTNLLIGKIYLSLGKITEAKSSLFLALCYDPTSIEAKELLSKI